MDLADLARFDDQPDLGAQALADQVVMHRGRRQQRRDRYPVDVHPAVGKDQDVVSLVNHVGGVGAKLLERRRDALGAVGRRAADVQGIGVEGGIHQVLDMADLLQIDVRQNRLADLQALVGAAGLQVEEVGPRPDQGDQRHHRFLADRVDGRVGDLGEVLVEIVEKQFRPLRQHRRRDVPAHGPDRVQAFGGHGGEEELDVFLGVAESLLTVEKGLVVRRHGRHLGGQVLEVDLGFVQPCLIRLGAGQFALQLVVVDDALPFEVDEQHLARLQPPFLDDPILGNRQHAHFRTHDHDIVVGDDIARRAQAVAVQGRADLAAVGKGDGRRPVPGLHDGGVVFVKGPALVVHERMPVPGFRDHHHDRVGQRIAAGDQQLQGVVEGSGIRGPVADQRPQLFEVVAQQFRLHGMAARQHPVDVAPDGVDLAVMTEVAERLRQRPRREGVGGEPLMDQGEGRFEPLVVEVQVVLVQVGRQHHALVDDGAGRQRRDVKMPDVLDIGVPDHVVGPFADDVELALESVGVGAVAALPNEDLADDRFDGLDAFAETAVVDGDVAPAEQVLALVLDRAFDGPDADVDVGNFLRQEDHADRVFAGFRQLEAQGFRFAAEKTVRELDQDAGAVTGQRIGADRAAVVQIDENLDALANDLMRLAVLDIGDKADTAAVMFVLWVVQALCFGQPDRSGPIALAHFCHILAV